MHHSLYFTGMCPCKLVDQLPIHGMSLYTLILQSYNNLIHWLSPNKAPLYDPIRSCSLTHYHILVILQVEHRNLAPCI